jgi:hypothetical protein
VCCHRPHAADGDGGGGAAAAAAAVEQVKAMYNWPDVANRTAAVYRSVLTTAVTPALTTL